MNIGFYEDLDTNFEEAVKMADQNFMHDELIELLKNGNIPQKQIAALKLDEVRNSEEAILLVSNLTGCDGKIREAVALKINQILMETPEKALYFNQAEIFVDASIDINANICRLVLNSVSILIKDDVFAITYLNKLLLFIKEAFKEIDKFIFRDKKYVINKQLFKLYWCLEAFKLFVDDLSDDVVLEILERASKEKEYTIREKVAQILSQKQSKKFDKLKETLKLDENYYVRQAFKNARSS